MRGPSLVSQHTAKLKAASKPDDKDAAIWDHERDMSVGGRLMDDTTRERMVREARSLGDRFGKGKFVGGS